MDFDWKVLAAATNATVISAAIAVGANIYCRVPVNAILFAKVAAVTAAIAELPLLHGHCYCHCHCHHVEVRWNVVAVAITAFANTNAIVTTVIAIVRPLLSLSRHCHLCATIYCGDFNRKSSMLHIFISFHFDNDGGDGNGDGNDDSNGDGDD